MKYSSYRKNWILFSDISGCSKLECSGKLEYCFMCAAQVLMCVWRPRVQCPTVRYMHGIQLDVLYFYFSHRDNSSMHIWRLVLGIREQATHKIHYTRNWNLNIVDEICICTCLASLFHIVSRRPSLLPIPAFSFFLFENFLVIWWHVRMCEQIWPKKAKSESKSDVKEFWLPSRIVVFRLHWAASSLFSNHTRTLCVEQKHSSAQFVSVSYFYAKAK